MGAKYVQEGSRIDYTPAADVAAGDVVAVGSSIGIADRAIAAGELGSLSMVGVYEFPKIVGNSIGFGDPLEYDSGHVAADNNMGSPYVGICVRAAAVGDATVLVRLGNRN